MLTMVEEKEIPALRVSEKPPHRLFAEQTLDEFESVGEGVVVEVTGYPEHPRNPQKVYQSLKDELWRRDMRDAVRVFTRQGRIFMERKEDKKLVKVGKEWKWEER